MPFLNRTLPTSTPSAAPAGPMHAGKTARSHKLLRDGTGSWIVPDHQFYELHHTRSGKLIPASRA